MQFRRLVPVVALSCAAVLLPVASADATTPPRKFANCTAMHKVYPHGVGRVGARDRAKSGKPVTTFKRSNAIYRVNTARDGDKDGVACEKR